MSDNRIMALSEYQIAMETIADSEKSTMVVSLKYPANWKVIKQDETSGIKMLSNGGITYYWVEGSVEISSILDLIDETIELNKDLEERVKLLQAKVEELKDIFMEEDLEKLKKIRFVFTAPRGRRSSTKKTTTAQKKETKAEPKKVDKKDKSKPNGDVDSTKVDKKDESKTETTVGGDNNKQEVKEDENKRPELIGEVNNEPVVKEVDDGQSIDDKIAEAINDKNTEKK